MAKIIENKYLKQRKSNIKALQILIDQYLTNGKREAVKKIEKEQ